jgi:hypothetical protein
MARGRGRCGRPSGKCAAPQPRPAPALREPLPARLIVGLGRKGTPVLLLPFDIRADRVGWTVFAVATGRPASLGDVPLVGLSLEDAEALANGLNAVEVKCADLARRRVLDDLGTAWLYNCAEDRLPRP